MTGMGVHVDQSGNDDMAGQVVDVIGLHLLLQLGGRTNRHNQPIRNRNRAANGVRGGRF